MATCFQHPKICSVFSLPIFILIKSTPVLKISVFLLRLTKCFHKKILNAFYLMSSITVGSVVFFDIFWRMGQVEDSKGGINGGGNRLVYGR